MDILFVKPDISEKEIDSVVKVLRSGWITTGPVTKEFERELANFMGTSKVAAVNSQTSGGELILRLLGIGPGDEVIVPAYTYTASCSIVYHCGAKPIMIDSQEGSSEMDYEALAAAITGRTKAIIPVDLGGVPCDYDLIYEIIRSKSHLFRANNEIQEAFNRVVVVADTAHSLGGEYRGEKTGKIADFSSFSFHAVKNLTTAEGGAITWRSQPFLDDEKLYREFMLLSLHGQTRDALSKTESGQWEYDIVAPLYKCNMTDLGAAIGLSQLRRYGEILGRRKEIVERYDRAFSKLDLDYLNHFEEGRVSSYHLYLIRLRGKSEEERKEFIDKMAKRGVHCNVHYKPLPMLTAYKDKGFDIADYPRAYAYYENLVSLPLYSTLSDEEVGYIIKSVEEIIKTC